MQHSGGKSGGRNNYQMEVGDLFRLLMTSLFISVSQSDTGQEVTSRELHVCNNPGAELIITCPSSHVLLVESAVVGVSDGWRPGLVACPRDNEACVQQIQEPADECNYQSSCSLPQSIIARDLHNGCSLTNYIHINYTCVSASYVSTSGSVDQDRTTFPVTSSVDGSETVEGTTESESSHSPDNPGTEVPTAWTDVHSTPTSAQSVCQMGCILGVVLAVIVLAAGAISVIFIWRIRKRKDELTHRTLAPHHSLSFDTCIVDNSNYTGFTSNLTASTKQSISPNQGNNINSDSSALGFPNPDYWDGDIMAIKSGDQWNTCHPEPECDYSEIPGDTKRHSGVGHVCLDIIEPTMDRDSGLENEYYEIEEEIPQADYGLDDTYSEIKESDPRSEKEDKVPPGYELVHLDKDGYPHNDENCVDKLVENNDSNELERNCCAIPDGGDDADHQSSHDEIFISENSKHCKIADLDDTLGNLDLSCSIKPEMNEEMNTWNPGLSKLADPVQNSPV